MKKIALSKSYFLVLLSVVACNGSVLVPKKDSNKINPQRAEPESKEVPDKGNNQQPNNVQPTPPSAAPQTKQPDTGKGKKRDKNKKNRKSKAKPESIQDGMPPQSSNRAEENPSASGIIIDMINGADGSGEEISAAAMFEREGFVEDLKHPGFVTLTLTSVKTNETVTFKSKLAYIDYNNYKPGELVKTQLFNEDSNSEETSDLYLAAKRTDSGKWSFTLIEKTEDEESIIAEFEENNKNDFIGAKKSNPL